MLGRRDELRPGALLAGRYRIEAEIGAGAFGTVLRARQEPLGTEVAIKVLLDSAARSQEATHRFFREARLAQRLVHPNTVRILDAGVTEAGRPFIVWEHLRGRTLAEHLAQVGKLSDEEARTVASQVLKSLMEAHGLGVVHRDLKPSNLFITSHPGEPMFVKLLDFGVAKDLVTGPREGPSTTALFATPSRASGEAGATGEGAQPRGPRPPPMLTRESQLLGTPRYMAPEQMGGGNIGPWSDLYALGLVLAEMVSGKPAYGATDAIEVLLERAHSSATPLDPAVRASALREVIVRATALRPEDRYASAGAMLAALQASPRWTRPRTLWLLLAAALIGAGVIVAVLVASNLKSTSNGKRAEGTPSTTATPAVPSSASPGLPIEPEGSRGPIPNLDSAEMLRRALKAGFVEDPDFRPTEFRNASAHTATVMLRRDGCSGVVQYFEQRDPRERTTLLTGIRKNADAPQVYAAGERVVMAAMSRNKVRDAKCMADAIDAMLAP